MALTIEAGDYESIRKLIDINLTAATLSDDVIALDVYKQAAIDWVKARTSNEDAAAKRAALYKESSLLALVIPTLTSESNAGYSYQRKIADPVELSQRLEASAIDYINISEQMNQTQQEDASDGSFFDVAERSRCSSLTGSLGDIFDA